MSATGTLWRVGGASVRGASHVRRGQPNQDAIACTPDRPAARVIGAVSDGHGAAAHFRSDVGAALAVESAIEMLAWAFDEDGGEDGPGALAGELLDLWRRRVEAHLADHPYREAEALTPQALPLSPYGATLAAFVASDTLVTALHIGDGDLVAGYPDGRLDRPLPDDLGLVGEETYSLCLPDAARHFRVATLWNGGRRPWPDFLLASSDGIAKSFRDDAAFMEAAQALRARALEDWPRLLRDLPDWLQQITERGSGDDCTLCIAVRAPHPAPTGISKESDDHV